MSRLKLLNLSDTSLFPDLFAPLYPYCTIVSPSASIETLSREIVDSDIYFANIGIPLSGELMLTAPRLKIIATASTGTDHLDLITAQELNIDVLSIKNDIDFLNTITATAEQSWGLLLGLIRKIPWAFNDICCYGKWERERFRGHMLVGKTLGVLGYGRLGRMVADYGLAFGMKVIVCDIKESVVPNNIEKVDIQTLFSRSEVISIHIHLNDSTRHLINHKLIDLMKKNAVIINTSRGAIIDESALLKALNNHQIAGAGLDVLEGELNGVIAHHPLVEYARIHDNLLISPHVGGAAYEAQLLTYKFVIEKILNKIKSKT